MAHVWGWMWWQKGRRAALLSLTNTRSHAGRTHLCASQLDHRVMVIHLRFGCYQCQLGLKDKWILEVYRSRLCAKRCSLNKEKSFGALQHFYLPAATYCQPTRVLFYPSHRGIELFTQAIWALHYFFYFPPPAHSGTTSLPWLGGCNLLQAAGQAERSPSYLDKGSPRKSYQRQGVFKYSRNCSNHFLLSLQSHTSASSFKSPTLCFPYFLNQFFKPSTTTTTLFPNVFPPVVLPNTLPLPQHFLL